MKKINHYHYLKKENKKKQLINLNYLQFNRNKWHHHILDYQ